MQNFHHVCLFPMTEAKISNIFTQFIYLDLITLRNYHMHECRAFWATAIHTEINTITLIKLEMIQPLQGHSSWGALSIFHAFLYTSFQFSQYYISCINNKVDILSLIFCTRRTVYTNAIMQISNIIDVFWKLLYIMKSIAWLLSISYYFQI